MQPGILLYMQWVIPKLAFFGFVTIKYAVWATSLALKQQLQLFDLTGEVISSKKC